MKNRCPNIFMVFAVGLLAFANTNLHAQQYTVLHTFAGWPTDGRVPIGRLTLSGHTLYGTTSGASTNSPDVNGGIVFSLNTDGTGYTVLHSFLPTSDGNYPNGGLALSGNTLYGVAEQGGPNSWGTLYSINTDGSGFNVMHSFSMSDGTGFGYGDNNPSSDLLLSGDTLYGLTLLGILYSINSNGANFSLLAGAFGTDSGAGENDFGLVMADNNFYGVSTKSPFYGFVYSCTNSGSAPESSTVLRFFGQDGPNSPSGIEPTGRLALGGNTLYGLTAGGGTYGYGTIFSLETDFPILTDGSGFTNLHSFNGSDGAYPGQGLVLAGDTLYGVASGTMFSIKTDGSGFTVLHAFTGGADGGGPWGGLILSGCTLYGTCSASTGGSFGTVFSYAMVPGISSCALAETNLVLNLTNGVANCAYTVLMSTDLTLPPGQWTPIATNVPVLAGNFTFTATNAVDPAVPQRFFQVRSQ